MKYIELKASLKSKIENAYLIFGDDRYLCYDALKKIEDALSITIKDMNSVTISGDKITAKEIVEAANMYPFGDEYRLVVVKDFAPAKNKEEYKVIENYLKAPLSSTVVVFFNPDAAEFYKGMANLTVIDCSKIEPKVIAAFIKNNLAKNEIQASEEAIENLIMFCDSDMTRITNELEKLIAYVADTKTLTADIVKEFVVQDKEYQVFELAEFIAKGESKKAIDLVDEAASRLKIWAYTAPPKLKELENKLAHISAEKEKAVISQSFEREAKLRDDERKVSKKYESAKAEW